ncbi:MAG: L-2-amino-thiazoline-4-carboxylic acid hydrolase [Pseudomonadota bacterium]
MEPTDPGASAGPSPPQPKRSWLDRNHDSAILNATLKHLGLPNRQRRALTADILAEAARLTAADTAPRPDPQTSGHRATAYLILAADRALANAGIDPAQRRAALAHGISTPGRSLIAFATRAMLWGRRDRLTVLADYSETQIPQRYGASFTFETAERSPDLFVQSITRCAYHDVFTRHGEPALTQIMCAFDTMWIDATSERRDQIAFKRPTTLAEGGPNCRFEFHRTSKPDPDTGQNRD